MDLRVLEINDLEEASRALKALDVHKGGVDIMAPKSVVRIIKINGIDSVALNILKQDMLSVGGDCAVAWDAFIKRKRDAEGLVIGTAAQIDRLCEKLKCQPLGLAVLAEKIRAIETAYDRKDFLLRAGKYKLNLGRRAHIMGILNVTPDSFSDGGEFLDKDLAIERALEIEAQGADIIDIGGESTRPGARAVPVKEECARVIPVLKAVARRVKIPISIDTRKPKVAGMALECGATIVNDITGLRKGAKTARSVKKHKAAIVLMHMKGSPRTMQKDPKYGDLMGEIIAGLRRSINIAREAGISDDRIVVDPGLGFGKTPEHNLEILKKLRELRLLGFPVMVGPSRKSFIGKITGAPAAERQFGTAAASAAAIMNGANIIRVHDVAQMRQVAQITEAISNA